MVSKASEDFPDPEGPVSTISRRCGSERVKPRRLCCRAPLTMRWRSTTLKVSGEVGKWGCQEAKAVPTSPLPHFPTCSAPYGAAHRPHAETRASDLFRGLDP